ncbi:hypothetical protein PHLGIDRAFT_452583 [Phlebiopsis gigantea 11061_1 CR5-6]|uniref:Uncharacterized protein n=1 Tax=Phlebiopsis gigantea (strain 11061_1 CR5-6) TaxID=745531 RepID=A0A0C3S9X5_PHLG1|nr:hypothetical protein PHLGIDRAFT_452583 [Phlebiopsis gigantea 11061_1 CR5-6]
MQGSCAQVWNMRPVGVPTPARMHATRVAYDAPFRGSATGNNVREKVDSLRTAGPRTARAHPGAHLPLSTQLLGHASPRNVTLSSQMWPRPLRIKCLSPGCSSPSPPQPSSHPSHVFHHVHERPAHQRLRPHAAPGRRSGPRRAPARHRTRRQLCPDVVHRVRRHAGRLVTEPAVQHHARRAALRRARAGPRRGLCAEGSWAHCQGVRVRRALAWMPTDGAVQDTGIPAVARAPFRVRGGEDDGRVLQGFRKICWREGP